MQKVEEPKIAHRRYAISMTIAIGFLCFAFYISLIAGTQTKSVAIGEPAKTYMDLKWGLVAAAAYAIAVFMICVSSLFYLGWKHDHNKFMENHK